MKKISLILFFISTISQAQFYYLKGTIGDEKATMIFNEEQQIIDSIIHCKFFGNYSFDNQNIPFEIETQEFYTDSLLTFTGIENDVSQESKIKIDGKYKDSIFIGKYKNGTIEKPIKFKLTESQHFEFMFNDSISYDKKSIHNKGNYSAHLVLPKNLQIQEYFIDKLFANDTYNSVLEVAQQQFKLYSTYYIEVLDAFYQSFTEEFQSMNYEYVVNFQPIVMNDNYILYSESVYEYSGGAHGNYFINYYNYFTEKNKIITAYDVFLPNSEKNIAKIIEKKVREIYNIPTDINDLQDVVNDNIYFLVDKMPFTDNIIISSNGITFVYQTYEVTPYVYGIFEVFVPNEMLRKYMR